jgi:L-cysteine S-thiosulfotransferase
VLLAGTPAAAGAPPTASAPPTGQTAAAAEPAIIGDAIPVPLTDQPGDAERGRALVADRQKSLCLLCHTAPFGDARAQGDLAPPLAGVGDRLSAGQIRLRLVDGRRLNPASPMPAYFKTDGLQRVARIWRDRPIFSAQQIEDTVAYLRTLRAGP